MKAKKINMMTLALLPVALLTLTSCSSQPPPPVGSARVTYTKGVPGGVILQTVKIVATVAAIDPAKRQATLVGPDGQQFTAKVGPEVVNFDQVRFGDRVAATMTERIVASLDKEGAASGGRTAEANLRTATVTALDLEKRTATMRFDNGPTETLPLRDDVDLSRFKVGQRVIFRVTEATVIGFEKLP
jgi:hypothetical protein